VKFTELLWYKFKKDLTMFSKSNRINCVFSIQDIIAFFALIEFIAFIEFIALIALIELFALLAFIELIAFFALIVLVALIRGWVRVFLLLPIRYTLHPVRFRI